MSRTLTDRTTVFELDPGQSLEVRILGYEIPDVWTVKLDEAARSFGKTYVEIRLLVVRE